MINLGADIKPIDLAEGSVAFDLDAFEEAIQSHGIELIHYLAVTDPIGLTDKNGSRRPNLVDSPLRSNGFLYIKAGTVKSLMSGATKEVKASSGGITDSGVAQITPCRFYMSDDETFKKVYLAPYDRLYLAQEDILVTRHELVEASITGVDTLKFPAVSVLVLVDSEGREYTQESFDVLNGKIHWKQNAPKPAFDPETNKGQVYSVKYEMRPYYYIQRLVHDLRVVQSLQDGERVVKQAQQSAIVAREYLIDTLQPVGPGQPVQNNIEQPS